MVSFHGSTVSTGSNSFPPWCPLVSLNFLAFIPRRGPCQCLIAFQSTKPDGRGREARQGSTGGHEAQHAPHVQHNASRDTSRDGAHGVWGGADRSTVPSACSGPSRPFGEMKRRGKGEGVSLLRFLRASNPPAPPPGPPPLPSLHLHPTATSAILTVDVGDPALGDPRVLNPAFACSSASAGLEGAWATHAALDRSAEV